MIRVSELNVSYGRKRAVDNLDLSIGRGESVLLAGANGSGKTTLLRVIAGVLLPDCGGRTINGENIGHGTRRITAYIPASVGFYDSLSIRDAIALHGSFYPNFEFRDLAGLSFSRKRKVGSLSKGEKTLFLLTLALATKPEYLMIDDVVHFLDPHLRELFLKSILELIEENQLTVIIAAQSSFEIEGIFDRILIMDKGKIIVDEKVDHIKSMFVKIYSEKIPENLPVVFSRPWEGMYELFLYPFGPEIKVKEKIHHLRLPEILRAFIGGEYGSH